MPDDPSIKSIQPVLPPVLLSSGGSQGDLDSANRTEHHVSQLCDNHMPAWKWKMSSEILHRIADSDLAEEQDRRVAETWPLATSRTGEPPAWAVEWQPNLHADSCITRTQLDIPILPNDGNASKTKPSLPKLFPVPVRCIGDSDSRPPEDQQEAWRVALHSIVRIHVWIVVLAISMALLAAELGFSLWIGRIRP